MGDNLILLCAYGGNNIAVMFDVTFTFSRLVSHVCDRFGDLSPDSISMFFKITGYNKFNMENEMDLQNILYLARSFQVDHIGIVVKLQGGSSLDASQKGVVEDSHGKHIHGGGSGLMNDFGEDEDLLPNFCPHAHNMLLSESWASCISNVGQCFEGEAGEFRKVLNKYAIECGFQFKFRKNDSVRITAVCMFNESRGCLWSVHARMMNVNGFFYLKKWNSEHTCGVAVRTAKNLRMEFELVADVMVKRVRDKPLTHPTDVKYHFQKDYGLQVSYHVAWLGVEKARGELFGDHSSSFD
ncbi:uncharacterized protein LOC114264399 [Camellia sinensis]|uniref:uncharacterized protein LOC114264399 n=1 Tax=Camellia sinensis TaxID=4442 RepID=UPI0010355B02|nr:uncharacterized protein LOC114264399 [Camellia sinensis]